MNDQKSLAAIAKNTFWTLKLIFRYNPQIISALALFQILTASVPFLRNKIFSQLLDSLIYHHSSQLMTYFMLFVVFLILTTLFSFFQNQLSRILDTRLQSQLRTMFIRKVSSLDYQHHESKEIGNLISKVDEEFGWRMRQTITDVSNVFTNLISLLTVTLILFPRYPFLWVLIFVSQIPQYLIERYWVQQDWRLREQNSDKNKLMWDLNYQLRTKNFVSELRINNTVSFLFEKFKESIEFFSNKRVELRIRQAPSEVGLIIISTSINAICLYVLIRDAGSSVLTIGLFTFLFQTIQQTSDFFRGLVYSSVSITENSYHIGNFRRIISLKNIIQSGNRIMNSSEPPLIEFRNVSFKYPDSKKYVFKNLNLIIKPREEIAIVGPNGAGKSTLIKLICRFYDPTEGQIMVNGINLQEIDLENWYRQLSFLSQEFNLYWNLNLRDNIAIGSPGKISDKKILTALTKADAAFYKKYDQGLDTPMSQRYGGEAPSWGQSQKIAIARVFYRNSPVVILDEPTASIDAVSESKIFNRLYRDIKGNTLIIVSHRFSTVRNAQRIIVIENGRIVEQGSHSELLKKKGVYAHSFHLQAKGYN